jgi:hypothetical protein
MTSPTKEYLKKQNLTTATLQSITFPKMIRWKYELSSNAEEVLQSTLPAEERAKGYRVGTELALRDVVNFFYGDTPIGRLYFLKEPPEIESLNGRKFKHIETILRKKLGLQ